MTGTFGGALGARKIRLESLAADAKGEIEDDDGVLILRRVRVELIVGGDEKDRETIDRVHEVFANHCPVYRSITPSIEVTTSWRFE
ncbi:MAG: OsmC family protein [Thermoanaerobaculia bacterium]|nr:OsmC family protein [Thermoanaerobaculia bacterium]